MGLAHDGLGDANCGLSGSGVGNGGEWSAYDFGGVSQHEWSSHLAPDVAHDNNGNNMSMPSFLLAGPTRSPVPGDYATQNPHQQHIKQEQPYSAHHSQPQFGGYSGGTTNLENMTGLIFIFGLGFYVGLCGFRLGSALHASFSA